MQYEKLVEKVTTRINGADPLGLIKGGAPLDEYSGEVAKIVVALQHVASKDDLATKLRQIFPSIAESNICDALADELMSLKE